MVFFPGYDPMEFFVILPVPGINAAITDHFIMLFRNMADKTPYEVHNRKRFFHIFVIFMAVVMESDKITVIVVNPGSGDDRTSEIAANIFDHRFRVTLVGFGIDIETVLVFPVTAGFHFFKGWTNFRFHFVKQSGTEGIAKEHIVKMTDVSPETIIAVAAFGNETVDVRIPF